jgi:ArsR family transcriptional regulator
MHVFSASMDLRPDTPAAAAACCGPIDRLLNPELFKALCDPTRAGLLACIAKCGRPCSVSEVAACCSVDTSVVSRHLATLEKAGVLVSEREGRVVRYSVRFADLSATLRALADAIDACCPEDSRLAPREPGHQGGACCDC